MRGLAALVFLTFTRILFPGAALVVGNHLLIDGHLFRCEYRLHAADLLVFNLEHRRAVGVADGFKLRFCVVEDCLKTANLIRCQLELRLHFRDVAMPEIACVYDAGRVVPVAEHADYNAGGKKQYSEESSGPLIMLHKSAY